MSAGERLAALRGKVDSRKAPKKMEERRTLQSLRAPPSGKEKTAELGRLLNEAKQQRDEARQEFGPLKDRVAALEKDRNGPDSLKAQLGDIESKVNSLTEKIAKAEYHLGQVAKEQEQSNRRTFWMGVGILVGIAALVLITAGVLP